MPQKLWSVKTFQYEEKDSQLKVITLTDKEEKPKPKTRKKAKVEKELTPTVLVPTEVGRKE